MKKLSAIALGGLLFTTAAVADEEINERRAADPTGLVEVYNLAGDLEITGWDKAEVWVSGYLSEDAERLLFEVNDKVTRIKVIYPEESSGEIEETDLEIYVPEGSRLEVDAVSADIEVANIKGKQHLGTVSGDIETVAYENDIFAKTISGDIDISGHEMPTVITADTISGDATLIGISGQVQSHTISGDIELISRTITRARLEAKSGDIEVKLELAESGSLDADTINGDIELYFSGDINATFDAKTFTGDIDTNFGPGAERTSKYMPGQELRFSVGTGSAQVRLETLNGSIEILRAE